MMKVMVVIHTNMEIKQLENVKRSLLVVFLQVFYVPWLKQFLAVYRLQVVGVFFGMMDYFIGAFPGWS